MKIELCIDSIEEAIIANQFHFNRVELCSALDVGGLTPSIGLIKACSQYPNMETHVMIRPRGGGFVYSDRELKIMESDINAAAECGAKGVVFGVLNHNFSVDEKHNERLLKTAKSLNLEATFHRAFDLTKDPLDTLQKIISLGFDRLLTSGQKTTAFEGLDLIKKLVLNSKNQIHIMAGSGIDETNALIIKDAGVDALHFTARKKPDRALPFQMGIDYQPDLEKIKGILNAINK